VKLDFTAFFSSKPRHLNITVASSALLMVSFGLKVESSYPLKIPASVTAFIYLAAQWFLSTSLNPVSSILSGTESPITFANMVAISALVM